MRARRRKNIAIQFHIYRFDRFRPVRAPRIPGSRHSPHRLREALADPTGDHSRGSGGRDVLGLAHTGTGKTAAFALPLLDRLLEVRRPDPRALVLAPTRELATQIAAEIRTLSKFTRLKTITVYGGVSTRNQINSLRRQTDIIVGCPGRVLDLLGQRALRLGHVETLVLDEADHMFDMGFLPDIRKILAAMPEQRQNLLFSATMPREIRRLADDLLTNPHVVELAGTAPVATVDHGLYMVGEGRKRVPARTPSHRRRLRLGHYFHSNEAPGPAIGAPVEPGWTPGRRSSGIHVPSPAR